MDRKEREVFEIIRPQLIDQIDLRTLEKLIARLCQEDHIDSREYEIIKQDKVRHRRVEELCNIVVRKRGSLRTIVAVLEEDEQFEQIVETYHKLIGKQGTCDEDVTDRNQGLLSKWLKLGGVPNLPAKVLPRQIEVEKVRQALLDLDADDILPVHGMAGAGKSVIVNQAVRNQLVFDKVFPQGIFWVTVGQVERESLLTKMQQLCVRLDIDNQPNTCETASEYLRKAFGRREFRDTLVVLDDVWSHKVLELFDVGCKLVVLTKDSSIFDHFTRRKPTIEVEPSLTESESLQLFSLHLGVPVESLPATAKEIHKEAIGSPMVIYMIGDLLANARNRRSGADYWVKYAKALADRRQLSLNHVTDYQFSSPLEAIGMSYNALEEGDKQRFKWFSAFMRDVNIPEKVLATIWGADGDEVEYHMDRFVKSTLAREMWDEPTKQFIYGIHDFVLEYLKRTVPEEEVKDLHRKIISRYQHDGKDFHEFPDDNYIFYFIGYHLEKSGQSHLFPSIFLDLRFVAAKLRATGPGDLINDMRKYKKYIVMNDEERVYLDFLTFVRHRGSFLAVHPEVDILQVAILEPMNSAVYKSAAELAKSSIDGPVYDWCNKRECNETHRNSLVVSLTTPNMTTACFTKDERRVLVASSEGSIKLMDIKTSRVVYTFTGHTDVVNHISLSQDGHRFVTSSQDRTCLVWNLKKVLKEADGIENENHRGGESLRPDKTPSPRSRQEAYRPMFDRNEKQQDPCLLFIYPLSPSPQVDVDTICIQDEAQPPASLILDELENGEQNGYEEVNETETDANVASSSLASPSLLPEISGISSLNLSVSNGVEFVWAEFNYNGTLVACAASHDCYIWSPDANEDLEPLSFDDPVRCCTFSPRDEFLAVATDIEITLFWNIDYKFVCAVKLHTVLALNLRFVPDFSLIAITSDEVVKWDCWKSRSDELTVNRTEIHSDRKGRIQCGAIRGDGKVVVGDESNSITLLDCDGQVLENHRVHSGKLTCIAFGKDHYFLSGSSDHATSVLELEGEPTCETTLCGRLMDARWTSPTDPNSLEIAIVNNTGIEVTRDLSGSKVASAQEESKIVACSFTAASPNVAWATECNVIKMMSLSSGEVATVGSHPGGMVSMMKFGPKGKILVTVGKEGTMMLWSKSKDTDAAGSPAFTCKQLHIPRIEVFQFYFMGDAGKDDQPILIVHKDGTSKIWYIKQARLADTISSNLDLELKACDLSSCKKYLAIADEEFGLRQFRTVEPKTSAMLVNYDVLTAKYGPKSVTSCRYSTSPGSSCLAVGYQCGGVELFNFQECTRLSYLDCHKSPVNDILFSSMCSDLFVTVGDKIAIWNLAKPTSRKNRTIVNKSWSPMPDKQKFDFQNAKFPLQAIELIGTTKRIRGNSDLSSLVAITDASSVYILNRL